MRYLKSQKLVGSKNIIPQKRRSKTENIVDVIPSENASRNLQIVEVKIPNEGKTSEVVNISKNEKISINYILKNLEPWKFYYWYMFLYAVAINVMIDDYESEFRNIYWEINYWPKWNEAIQA